MKRLVTILLVPVLVGACAGKPAEHREFLLPMPKLTAQAADSVPVRLLPVTVAPYLDQQGIVLQTSAAEVHVARHNRWAEPLSAAVDRYLQVAVANAADRRVEVSPLTTATAVTEVRVRIQQLHGTSAGRVRLVAEWSVIPVAGDRRVRTLDTTVVQGADGYPALVAAHAEALDQLAVEIARSLD